MSNEKQFTGTEIEEKVCIPFHNSQRYPMTEETTMLMMGFMMNPKKANDIVNQMINDNSMFGKSLQFIYNVLISRSTQFSFTFENNAVALFLAFVCERPGIVMLYLWYLQYWSKKNSVKEITFDDICTRIFPYGFPSEAELHKIWDSQKVRMMPDNLVDYQEAGKSLFQ